VGKLLDPGDNHVLSASKQGGETMVDHQKASQQGLPSTSSKTLTNLGKPVRGIDWAAIFMKHPELNPPGYEQASEAMRVAKLKTANED
jgi:hypothetical protein